MDSEPEAERPPPASPVTRLAGATKLAGALALLGGVAGGCAGLNEAGPEIWIWAVGSFLGGALLLRCSGRLYQSVEAGEEPPGHLRAALQSFWLFFAVEILMIVAGLAAFLLAHVRGGAGG
jgi:hypothetical protein